MESKNPTDPTGSIAASSVAYIQASEWVGSSHITQLTSAHLRESRCIIWLIVQGHENGVLRP